MSPPPVLMVLGGANRSPVWLESASGSHGAGLGWPWWLVIGLVVCIGAASLLRWMAMWSWSRRYSAAELAYRTVAWRFRLGPGYRKLVRIMASASRTPEVAILLSEAAFNRALHAVETSGAAGCAIDRSAALRLHHKLFANRGRSARGGLTA